MLKLSDLKDLGRALRQDDPPDLGLATTEHILRAIDEGRSEDAKRLVRYALDEGKGLHDLMCDWVWDVLTQIARREGEETMYEVLRASQASWMLRRTWRAFLAMSVERRVQLTAEIMRAHRSGPAQDGSINIVEDEICFTLELDPCGSGGRMRRGDPVDGTASRLGEPYCFGVTERPHPWSWGAAGVPYYCVHCAVNELLPMEWGGHPLWVTGYRDDPQAPCSWCFYKCADDIPEICYTRLGRTKPAPGEGLYAETSVTD